MLRCDTDLSTFVAQDRHFCEKCSYLLSEEQCKVFDSLLELEETLPYDVKSTLIYIVGYVTRKDKSNANYIFIYVEQFGRFTLGLDRGGLNIPGDSICEWVCFCYIIFYSVVKDVPCYLLCDILLDIAERFIFEVEKKESNILSNVFFNNNCRLNSLVSNCEPKVKVLKPSN